MTGSLSQGEGNTITVQHALIAGSQQLKQADIEGGARDSRLLMAHALGVEVGRLTLFMPDVLEEDTYARFCELINRRALREPVSHLLGQRQFYGRSFKVTPDVLDPRPETEILIEQALRRSFTSVLDMGTGSGAILLTLLSERPNAKGVGTDLSSAALEVARENSHLFGLEERAKFTQANWFAGVELQAFDLIVSNPPYIAQDEMPDLDPELSFEPRMALTDECDGVSAYKEISQDVLSYLAPLGWVLFEIGPTQGEQVLNFLTAAGCQNCSIAQDFDGRDRVVLGQAPS